MEFKCSICDFTSQQKACVQRHINRKNKCGDNPYVITIDGNVTCEYCNLVCKTRYIVNNHYKVCKQRGNSKLGELKELNNQHKSSIIHISGNINGNNNNINTNNTNTNNTNINVAVPVPLRPYFEPIIPEDIDDICEESWDKMKCITTYIERVFCNSEIPENHSMCITNLLSKLGTKVFNGHRWETLETSKFIVEIIARTTAILDKWVSVNKKRSKYRQTHDNYVKSISQSKLRENIDDEITSLKLLLHNYSKSKEINIKSHVATPMPQYFDDNE